MTMTWVRQTKLRMTEQRVQIDSTVYSYVTQTSSTVYPNMN